MAVAGAVQGTGRNESPWILGPKRDLALFVLPAVWILPMVWFLQGRFGIAAFGAAALAIGSVGHHLPGFLRAYTDPRLFRRHRARFIAAPVFFLSVSLLFAAFNLHSLTLLLVLWGTWHGALQVNGFLRIYDSKVSAVHPLTARLDLAMCVVWFAGAVLHSSTRLPAFFALFYGSGAPLVPPEFFLALRGAWDVLTVAVTVAFGFNAWVRARASNPSSPLKFVTMASGIGFWWFAMAGVDNLLLGLVLFEIYHDVQYNAIVWSHNRRRVAGGHSAGFVENFLFRPGPGRFALYALLIAGYGILGMVAGWSGTQTALAFPEAGTPASFWTHVFIVSGFLHFYFDGFIWKMRDPDVRQGLGLGQMPSEAPASPARAPRHSGLKSRAWSSGARWAVLFVLPAAALGYSEHRGQVAPMRAQYENLAAILPESWYVNLVVGSMETLDRDLEGAIAHYEKAAARMPEPGFALARLGDLYRSTGRMDLAIANYARAAELHPDDFELRGKLGALLLNAGRPGEAAAHLRAAADGEPANGQAAYRAALALLKSGDAPGGAAYLERAVALDPRDTRSLNTLGMARQLLGEPERAAEAYRRALRVDPQYADARVNLAAVEHTPLRETP